MNPEHLQVLDANKREMFDAMRAYQESERGHKTDAMALLGALLVAAGAVFGALVLPEKPVPYAGVLAFLAALAITLGAGFVVSTTNSKIDHDHSTYMRFGAEYMRTCEAMGLYGGSPYVPAGSAPIKDSRTIGQGLGYEYTKRILVSIGVTLSALSWLAFLFVALAVCSGARTCMPQQAAASPAQPASAASR